ncbi:MAG TPA: aminotransferase class III-fold pyridoxal phosphate-dependent enzyme, partial [Spirochaetota bacterium]|nr:aminotransferase class III-fold pyridoxal phosphate-dependent enzyme [Spirochaetota bacterium]
MTEKEILDLDRKHIWHPCSQMKEYEEFPAIPIKRGEGVWLYKENGDKILDAVSSWWVNIFGHSAEYIANKIAEQARTLEHVIFANYTHEPAVKLGAYLSGLFDGKLPRIFYGDNGSSGIEIALKMSYHYRVNNGDKKRKKFMYITGGYHGETVGALSVGSIEIFKEVYKPMTHFIVKDSVNSYCLLGENTKEQLKTSLSHRTWDLEK